MSGINPGKVETCPLVLSRPAYIFSGSCLLPALLTSVTVIGLEVSSATDGPGQTGDSRARVQPKN